MKTLAIILSLLFSSVSLASFDSVAKFQKYCEGDPHAFRDVWQLPAGDVANLRSYILSLRSDENIDEALKRYSSVSNTELTAPERLIYSIALLRKDSQFSKQALDLLAIPAKDETVEAYRTAILASQFTDADSAARSIPTLQKSLEVLKIPDAGLLSWIISADLMAGTYFSLNERYEQWIEQIPSPAYKMFVKTKFHWLKVIKDSENIRLGFSITDGFKKAYDLCPVEEEIVLTHAFFLVIDKNYEEAKTVLNAAIAGKRYYSPYLPLYLLLIASEEKDTVTIRRLMPFLNSKMEVFPRKERRQIRNIERTTYDNYIRYGIIITLAACALLILLRKILAKKKVSADI